VGTLSAITPSLLQQMAEFVTREDLTSLKDEFVTRKEFTSLKDEFKTLKDDVAAIKSAIERQLNLPAEFLHDKTCAVCMDELPVDVILGRTLCWHVFHLECIRAVRQTSTSCPMCRGNMTHFLKCRAVTSPSPSPDGDATHDGHHAD
jgi:Ring finger domain